LSLVQECGQSGSYAFVICVLLDGVPPSPFSDRSATHRPRLQWSLFLEDADEPFWGILSFRQKISVPCRSITLLCPEFEEQRALQDKRVPVVGLAEEEQHSFEAVLGEYESEIVVSFLSEIQKFLSNRRGKVFDF
jgi:hypothetical protein